MQQISEFQNQFVAYEGVVRLEPRQPVYNFADLLLGKIGEKLACSDAKHCFSAVSSEGPDERVDR
jgi:hypothetical protein